MRFSQLFIQTLRDAPSDAETTSHKLLVRAGYIQQLGAGIFSYLHLAKRSISKIENILRREMDAIGGQEISMPVVQPADIWKETGRWYKIGSEMGRFKDKNDRDMVLAMTHEEVVTDLVRRTIKSYKHLPRLVYHIQTKWRDDPRPRAGLIRVREFTMKDSYSLDADWEGLDKQYRAHYQAYFDIYHRCGLPAVAVKSDTGMMGGKIAHEFMYLSPIGEDTLMICSECGYTANRQVALFKKPQNPPEEPKAIEKVFTPEMPTIEALANFLNVPKSKTAKAVFLMADVLENEKLVQKFVFAIVRGDMEVNETKLTNAIHAKDLRPATEDEIKAIGAVPGFASPVGIVGADGHPPLQQMIIIVDDAVTTSPNLVSGANEKDYHLLNVNYGRDYSASMVVDIAAAGEGDACPDCGASLHAERGVEVGNIFKLGTHYSDALGCTYLDREGKAQPVIMGSYGIGVGRLLACIAEEHHDDYGLIWPITVAPFQVHLVLLRSKNDEGKIEKFADILYKDLQQAGIEVLYDDRDDSPGVKFNDADLIGIPIRLTVSEKALAREGVECKLRREADPRIIGFNELIDWVQGQILILKDEIEATVSPVPYKD